MKLMMPLETEIAYLPSAGLNFKKVTLHEYSHSAMGVTARDGVTKGTAHYFKCTETGVTRQWGFDS